MWRIALDRADWRAAPDADCLAEDEVARARRFHFEDDRRRFTVCRAGVRGVLAQYLQCGAADVRFRTGTHGKPFLDPETHGTSVRFNVSHSHELALVAVTVDRDVGVDIERVRPVDEIEAIVARHFTPPQQRAFAEAAPGERLRTFFACWTWSEAYLKGLGVGIGQPSPAGGDAAWTVQALAAGAGYAAAVAVAGPLGRVALRDWRS